MTLPKIREILKSLDVSLLFDPWLFGQQMHQRVRLATIYTYSSQFLCSGMPNCPSGKLFIDNYLVFASPLLGLLLAACLYVVVPTVQIRIAGPVLKQLDQGHSPTEKRTLCTVQWLLTEVSGPRLLHPLRSLLMDKVTKAIVHRISRAHTLKNYRMWAFSLSLSFELSYS